MVDKVIRISISNNV